MKIKSFAVAACLVFATVTETTLQAGDGWVSLRAAHSEIKREKRKGNILASAQCRNDPAVTNRLKPQAKLTWKANSGNKDWLFIYINEPGNWLPGQKPGDEKDWRRVSRDSFTAGNTGATYTCSLWVHKRDKAVKGRTGRSIYKRVGAGVRGIGFYQ